MSEPQILKNESLKKLVWPLAALALLFLFDVIFTPGFFHVEIKDGHLYGTLIDILNHGSQVMILAIGMTMVIATGGVDLSVGAIMAISGAVAAVIVNNQVPFLPGGFMSAVIFSLLVSLLAGMWNGTLVAVFRIQPIVATLILMVAGRGIAQLITDGQIITFNNPSMVFLSNGHFLSLPFSIWIVIAVLAAGFLIIRKTAVGLFIESIGDNENASRYSGVNTSLIKWLAYAFAGLCAGISGLIAASNIKCADANHAGLYMELDAILAVVIGGTSLNGGRFYLFGSVVGAYLIQTLTTTMYARNVSSDISPVPKAIFIIIVCLLQSPKFRSKAVSLFRRRKS